MVDVIDNLDPTAVDMSSIPDEDFVGAIFRTTNAIRSLHNIPRFGYPSDISLISSDTEEERLQYLYGTTFLSLTVLLVFAVWVVVLIFCKLLGPYRTGYFSGSVPLMPYPKDITDNQGENQPLNQNEEEKKNENPHHFRTALEEIEEWQYEYQALVDQMSRVRVTFFGCGIVVLAASFGIYVSGYSSLQKGFLNAKDEINTLRDTIDATSQQLRLQHTNSSHTIPQGELALERISAWCSNVETNFTLERIYEDDERYTYTYNKDGNVLVDVDGMRSEFIELYSTLGNMIADSSINVVDALDEASNNAQDETDNMDEFLWWYGTCLFFLLALDALTIIFMVGAYMASKTDTSIWFENLLSCVFLPIFAFLVNVSWMLTSGVATAAVLTADACSGSPEKNLVAIFHEKQQTLDPLLYSLTKYYIEDCMAIPVDTTTKPTRFVEDFTEYVERSIQETQRFLDFTKYIDSAIIDEACGDGTGIVPLRAAMSSLNIGLESLQGVTTNTSESLYCSVFTPVYTNIMHKQVCYRGVDAFSTIFFSMACLTIACMIMITLRVATHPIEFYDADHTENENDQEINKGGAAVTGLGGNAEDSSINSADLATKRNSSSA